MVIHAVAARDNAQATSGMLRERVQHVVEEADVGIDRDRAAIERELKIDLRLGGGAFDPGVTVAQLSAPFVVGALGALAAWR
jgi:hypothetical protein